MDESPRTFPFAVISCSSVQFGLESYEVDSSLLQTLTSNRAEFSQSRTSVERERFLERESSEKFWRERRMALLKWLVDPNRNPLAAMHMKSVATRLRRYGNYLMEIVYFRRGKDLRVFVLSNIWFGKLGLRYDDLHDPMYDLDVKEALNRLPREIVDARNQRLKRAMDLSMKHEYLPEDLQVFIYDDIWIRFWVLSYSILQRAW